jgi:hypothetical protein
MAQARSMLDHFMWDLWWIKWHWDRLCFEHFPFSPVSIIAAMLRAADTVPSLQLIGSLRNATKLT